MAEEEKNEIDETEAPETASEGDAEAVEAEVAAEPEATSETEEPAPVAEEEGVGAGPAPPDSERVAEEETEPVAEEPAPVAEKPAPAPKKAAPKKPKAEAKPAGAKPASPKPKARPARKAGERKPIVRLPKPERERGKQKGRRGVVVSSAMDKTIVVRVDTVRPHPAYKKVVTRSQKFHAHDEQNAANVGDVVRIVEIRPISKTKSWRLAEVLEVAK